MFPSIYLTSFLMTCMSNLVGIAMVLFLAQVKHCGPLLIGLAGFTGSFMSTVTTFMLARYSIKGRRMIFLYTPACVGIFYFLIPFVPLPAIYLCLIGGGISSGFFWPSVQKCFANTEDELQIGTFNLSWSAGVILGSFSAGIIFALNFVYPFIIVLPLSLIAWVAIMRVRGSLNIMGADTQVWKREQHEPLSTETIKEVRFNSFLHFLTSSSIYFLYPKLGLIRGFSPQFIASVTGVFLTARFVMFFLLMDKPLLLHPAIFPVSCTLFFISCYLVGLGNAPMVMTGVIIVGLAGAFTYHNSLQMHLKYGLKTEIHEGLAGAGTFVGALVAGMLGQIFNLPKTYVIIGTAIFLTGLWHSRTYLIMKISGKQTF